jgi:GNAT superfamily N-acetyltransferase
MTYKPRYPDTALALFNALESDPFYKTVAEAASTDPAESQAAMLAYLDFSLMEAETYGMLTFTPDTSLGAAAWKTELDNGQQEIATAEKNRFFRRHMGAHCLSVYEEISANMHHGTTCWLPSECWYLSIVGISPAAQGRGLGEELVRAGLRKADDAGVATYLETYTPRNKNFYTRLGFRDAANIHEPVTGAHYSVMIR